MTGVIPACPVIVLLLITVWSCWRCDLPDWSGVGEWADWSSPSEECYRLIHGDGNGVCGILWERLWTSHAWRGHCIPFPENLKLDYKLGLWELHAQGHPQ